MGPLHCASVSWDRNGDRMVITDRVPLFLLHHSQYLCLPPSSTSVSLVNQRLSPLCFYFSLSARESHSIQSHLSLWPFSILGFNYASAGPGTPFPIGFASLRWICPQLHVRVLSREGVRAPFSFSPLHNPSDKTDTLHLQRFIFRAAGAGVEIAGGGDGAAQKTPGSAGSAGSGAPANCTRRSSRAPVAPSSCVTLLRSLARARR